MNVQSEFAGSLVTRLGHEIVRDAFYQAEPWDHLSLVINLDGRKQMFGYIYFGNEWEAAGPDGMEPLEVASQLQQAMQSPGHAPWKRCLVTISRCSMKIEIDFDYDGNRWVPDLRDPEGFALGLKPSPRS